MAVQNFLQQAEECGSKNVRVQGTQNGTGRRAKALVDQAFDPENMGHDSNSMLDFQMSPICRFAVEDSLLGARHSSGASSLASTPHERHWSAALPAKTGRLPAHAHAGGEGVRAVLA